MIIHGTKENFQNEIANGIVLVDFFATWCGPCKMLTPVLEDLTNDRAEIKVLKIDVDECEDLARNYAIMSVPTLLLFKDGTEVAKTSGYMPKELLINWIEENQ